MHRFLMIIASILVGVALAYFITFLQSCGPVPHASCAVAQAWRCNGNTVEMCNGSFWQPIQNCDEMWDEEGNEVRAKCTADKGSAQCEKVSAP